MGMLHYLCTIRAARISVRHEKLRVQVLTCDRVMLPLTIAAKLRAARPKRIAVKSIADTCWMCTCVSFVLSVSRARKVLAHANLKHSCSTHTSDTQVCQRASYFLTHCDRKQRTRSASQTFDGNIVEPIKSRRLLLLLSSFRRMRSRRPSMQPPAPLASSTGAA